MTITTASLELFIAIANDADNWGGNPLLELSAAEKGNLTNLKRADLLYTMEDGGCTFAGFTEAGKALAAEHGIEI